MTTDELKYLRNRLLKEKSRFDKALSVHKELGFEDSLRESTNELSSYDNHPADIGSETFEMEKQFALSTHLDRQSDEISRALDRIEKGTYGLCEFCGNEIGFDRLKVLPEARLCIDCEKERKVDAGDLDHDRPQEELSLETPFERTFTGGSNAVYDGEDAWQDVQRYGSSSGPQDISANDLIDYDHTFYDSYEDIGNVEEVEKISNEEYKKQLPDSHGHSYDGYVEPEKETDVDYFGEKEP